MMSGGDGRTEPGFVFPVDAPKCCHHHVSRRRKEKTRGEKSSTVFHTWPVACWPHEKRNYFTGCRPVETINSYSTRKYKLQFVAGWPTNKQTQKHKAKRKITKGEGSRVLVYSQPCRKRSAFFGFSSSSLLLRFPYSPCCVARPGSKETVLLVVDSATKTLRAMKGLYFARYLLVFLSTEQTAKKTLEPLSVSCSVCMF